MHKSKVEIVICIDNDENYEDGKDDDDHHKKKLQEKQYKTLFFVVDNFISQLQIRRNRGREWETKVHCR